MHVLTTPGAAPRAGFAVRPRLAILLALTALNAFNHLDRQLTSILLEPIAREFGLGDIELGLLSGPVFALVYCALGFPFAIWATHRGRLALIAAAALVWGTATAACGLAQGFGQLVLGRLGVGFGEAGLIPVAQTLISDLYAPGERTTAMSIFAAGVNMGVFVAFLAGGLVAQAFGWRFAFVAAGIATLGLGLLFWLMFREPAPGGVSVARAEPGPRAFVTIGDTVGHMAADPIIRHVCLGATLTSTVGYGAIAWLPSFLIRAHGLGVGAAGLYLALVLGIGGAAGSWIGGVLSDRLRVRDIRWSLWLAALAVLAAKPLAIAFYLVGSTPLALTLFVMPGAVGSMVLGPSVATLHDRLDPALRPVASASFLVLVNLVGLGLGPPLVGLMSQLLFAGAGPRSLGLALVVLQILGVWGVAHYLVAGQKLAMRR